MFIFVMFINFVKYNTHTHTHRSKREKQILSILAPQQFANSDIHKIAIKITNVSKSHPSLARDSCKIAFDVEMT